jgi:hypothetical protein
VPTSFDVATSLVPIFSASKLRSGCFTDIVFPILLITGPEKMNKSASDWSKKKIKWDDWSKKKSRLVWRGSTAGGAIRSYKTLYRAHKFHHRYKFVKWASERESDGGKTIKTLSDSSGDFFKKRKRERLMFQ